MKKILVTIEKYGIWLVLGVAAVIRFSGLTKRDFWYDEAFTGIAVEETWRGMFTMITGDVHPPLYYGSLKIFASLFNYSVVGIRIYSAIFGVLAIWALYLFTKELFNKKAALFAAILATVSPFAIQYSQEGRMYSMFSFFVILAAYWFLRALKTGKIKFYIFWGIAAGIAALTHYMGVIFLPLYCAAYVLWKGWDSELLLGKASKKSFVKFIKLVLPRKDIVFGYITALLIFAPWLPYFFRHLTSRTSNLSWIVPASLGDIIINIQMFIFGTPLGEMSAGMPQPNEFIGVEHITTRVALTIALTLITLYLYKKTKRRELAVAYLFSFGFLLLIYILSLLGKQYFVARYLLAGAYFIFAIIGLWLSRLNWKYVIASFALYAILLLSIVPVGYSRGYNEMIKHLDKYQGKHFYILNSFDYVISKYYLGADNLTLYNYDWPEYNPDYWAAIGKSLKRTESYDVLRNDPKALIISNQQLTRDNQYFSTQDLVLVDRYENILIYRFQ